MEDIFTETIQSYNYYPKNQSTFYTMARLRERDNVLNKMQQIYENNYNYKCQSTIDSNTPTSTESNLTNIQNTENTQNNNTENPLSSILQNFNISNLASLLSGNGNFSNIILNAISKENKDLGNIVKLMQNPMIKKTFGKKNKVKNEHFGDKIESTHEIDSLEKIDNT